MPLQRKCENCENAVGVENGLEHPKDWLLAVQGDGETQVSFCSLSCMGEWAGKFG